MTFGILETLALILIAIGAIKMIILAINPDPWMKFASNIYKNTKLTQVIMFVLAAGILYLLLQAGLSITTILAVTLFASFLFAMALAPYAQKLVKIMKPKTVMKDNLLVVLLWVILIVWGLKELFF